MGKWKVFLTQGTSSRSERNGDVSRVEKISWTLSDKTGFCCWQKNSVLGRLDVIRVSLAVPTPHP